ncbi:MAG TPA: hypothetical protein DCQ98_09300 [Planctomycetaceae bacterium]|nr:hypothetical protein [Planctomycetaceae bacterium]
MATNPPTSSPSIRSSPGRRRARSRISPSVSGCRSNSIRSRSTPANRKYRDASGSASVNAPEAPASIERCRSGRNRKLGSSILVAGDRSRGLRSPAFFGPVSMPRPPCSY